MQTEEMVRFCPHCASIGEIGAEYRDCCPDGSAARHIPRKLAEVCRDTFKLAISSVPAQVPAAEVRMLPQYAMERNGQVAHYYRVDDVQRTLAHQSTADKACEVRAAELNMNERFSVTLTAFGAQARNNHYAWMREKYPEAAPRLSNEGDILNGQLWELMKIFGPHIHLGMPEVPFKGNAIRALAAPSTADSANTGALGEKGGRDDA